MRVPQAAYRVGGHRKSTDSLLAEVATSLPSTPVVKVASASTLTDAQIQKLAKQHGLSGLRRVAGNTFICPASKDFWKVADGKIMRLVGSEVDLGESLAAVSSDNPESDTSALTAALEY